MARLRNDNAAALIPDRTRELAEIADWYRRALADEPARFWLWFYALDDEGRPLHDNAVLQRLKGWGKDPMAAGGAVASCFAPLTFDHWDPRTGEPVGREEPNAWVQVCAVSQEQTKNTMKLLPGLIPMETRRHYGIQLGKLNMYALGDSRQIEAVTSSPLALEGGRPTFLIRNETQNWNSSNGGHDMDGVLSGNAAKSADGVNAKMLDICNAYRDGEDSVAQRVREAWEGTQGDPDSPDKGLRPKYMDFGLLYDSIEAAPDTPMTEESIPKVIADVRGDSDWLSTRRILKEIINPKNPVSESRRKWFNQCQAPEDAYVTSQEWDANEHPELELGDGEAIAMFLDCSLTDDATALVACRVADGFVKPLGLWQRPPGKRGDAWKVPREGVDDTVREATTSSPSGETPATCSTTKPDCTTGTRFSTHGTATTGAGSDSGRAPKAGTGTPSCSTWPASTCRNASSPTSTRPTPP